jgi:hypothetical protein
MAPIFFICAGVSGAGGLFVALSLQMFVCFADAVSLLGRGTDDSLMSAAMGFMGGGFCIAILFAALGFAAVAFQHS